MKKLLLLLSILLFISCSKEDIETTDQCDCTKTYYVYYPAMGNGPSYIPARYEVVDTQIGNFNCSDETNNYVAYYTSYYTHYKIDCE
jgi:hypothetical protein